LKTIGAKISDEVYEECEWVKTLLGLESRSDYVKLALKFLNALVRDASESIKTSLTSSGHPVEKLGEPNAQTRTEGFASSSPTDKPPFEPEPVLKPLLDKKPLPIKEETIEGGPT